MIFPFARDKRATDHSLKILICHVVMDLEANRFLDVNAYSSMFGLCSIPTDYVIARDYDAVISM